MSERLHVVVITGMGGAGRSTAIHVLEDLGFYCVDNLPPPLFTGLLDLLERGNERGGEGGEEPPKIRRVGLGVDVRTGAFFEGVGEVVEQLRERGHEVELIFLDASDEALVRRFSETRRPHPLAPGGDLLGAIQKERARLVPLRAQAEHTLDTTHLSVHDLRRALVDHLARGGDSPLMVTRVMSFGFKYGLPVDADLVFDLRFLPNPHFVPELRPKTGLEPEVAKYVLETDDARELFAEVTSLLDNTLPKYEREGKSYLTIAIGCTGGRHRSVAFAEALAKHLRESREVVVAHRDAGRKLK
jgi:UPF0042 nucleotide-binding protein